VLTRRSPNRIDPAKASLFDSVSGIEGWTYPDELWTLHEAVRNFPGYLPLTVVEIGSWKGRSTVALAMGLRSRGHGKVYAIDPHTGSREHIDAYGAVDTFGDFLQNIRNAGVADFVEAIRSPSHDARVQFEPNSVNVLFIDGSHEYRDVLQDIDDWASRLTDPAVVAFNDPLYPGVYQALRETVLKKNSPYRDARYVANTLFFRFHRRAWSLRDSVSLLWVRTLLALRLLAQGPATHAPKWAIAWGRRVYELLLP
jgi:predicted O-methyltransferase YrrM